MKTALRILMFAIAILLSPAAFAQTQAPAPTQTPAPGHVASPMHGACKGDIKLLCSGVQKGGGMIRACLKQHAADLSPGCSAAMQERAAAHAASRAAATAPAPTPAPAGVPGNPPSQ